MKTPLSISLLIVASIVTIRGDIVPSDTKTPLFELYEMILLPHTGSDPHMHHMKLGKLLLDVHTLRDLRLLPDGSGVKPHSTRRTPEYLAGSHIPTTT